MTDPDDLIRAKAALRQVAMARRDALPADQRRAAATMVAAQYVNALPVTEGCIVSGYCPMKSEFDPMPLISALGRAGVSLALPVVIRRGEPLVMRAWRPGAPLKPGVWGIGQPTPDAAEVLPDILLVPLLAFDRRRHRLGYGAGFYDRTITRLRALKTILAVGVGYAAQEFTEVPAGPRDARLDLVLTENGLSD